MGESIMIITLLVLRGKLNHMYLDCCVVFIAVCSPAAHLL